MAIFPIVDPSNGQVTSNYSGSSNLQSEVTSKLSSFGGATKALSSNVSKAVNPNALTAPLLNNTIPASVTPGTVESKTYAFKVRLSAEPRYGDAALNQVVFEVMPTIAEAQSANYAVFSPIQHPGEILKYSGTSSRTWGLTIKLISRTPAEATDNLRKINIIRSWLLPFYGNGTANDPSTKQYLGAPPPIITLSAYGENTIGPVKCVQESYNWEWPNDCDWINTDQGTPFPVIGTLTINLKESWSPAEYSSFDISAYRRGNLSKTFNGSPANSQNTAKGSQQSSSNIPPLLDARNIAASQPITVKNPLDITKEALVPFTSGSAGVSVSKNPNLTTATNVSKNLLSQPKAQIDVSNSPVAKLSGNKQWWAK